MAYSNIARTVSIKATVAITQQFSFVKLDSSGQIVLGTAGAYCVGVVQDKPGVEGGLTNIAGMPGAVALAGNITKVLCGGSFNAGQDVACDANGKCVAATSGAYVLGIALSAGVSGFIADIIFQPKGKTM